MTYPYASAGFAGEVRTVRTAKRSRRKVRLGIYATMLALDCLAIAAGLLAANTIRFGRADAAPGVTMLGVLVPMYAIFATMRRNYCALLLKDWRASIRRGLTTLGWAAAATLFVDFYLRAFDSISRGVSTTGVVLSAALLCLDRYGLHLVLRGRRLAWLFNEIVIVDRRSAPFGAAPPAERLVDARALGIAPDVSDPATVGRLGGILKDADRVIVSCDAEATRDWAAMLRTSGVRGELLMPEISPYGSVGVGAYGAASTLVVSDAPLKLSDQLQKRLLDIAVSSVALLFCLPLFLLVAIAIKAQSPGSVFFRQMRMGLGNQLFPILKFRTMYVDAGGGAGSQSTRRGDDRITPIGRLLRRSSIDELPQLINVLKGDMSIVGPRPHALGSLAGDKLFWEVDRRYWERHAAKPGITGLAQIRGFRGPTEHESDLSQRLMADLDYLRDWSIWRDLAIMAATIKVVFHRNAF